MDVDDAEEVELVPLVLSAGVDLCSRFFLGGRLEDEELLLIVQVGKHHHMFKFNKVISHNQ